MISQHPNRTCPIDEIDSGWPNISPLFYSADFSVFQAVSA